MKRKLLILPKCLFVVLIFLACEKDEVIAPKALENVGEKVFGTVDIENQIHLGVKNDSGGVYIYGYPNQDIIETMLYRTVSAESKTLAQQRLVDVELRYDKTEDQVNLYTTIATQPGRLRYSSWYSLEIPNKMVLNIENVWDDITVFDMDTTLAVVDAGHNISIVRHTGSAQLNTLAGDIYMEIAIPDSGYCSGETDAGDIIVRVPQETSAAITLISQQGSVSVKNLDVKNEVVRPGSFEGQLGLGEGEIQLETVRGSIVLESL